MYLYLFFSKTFLYKKFFSEVVAFLLKDNLFTLSSVYFSLLSNSLVSYSLLLLPTSCILLNVLWQKNCSSLWWWTRKSKLSKLQSLPSPFLKKLYFLPHWCLQVEWIWLRGNLWIVEGERSSLVNSNWNLALYLSRFKPLWKMCLYWIFW